jgi:hypothetical protein
VLATVVDWEGILDVVIVSFAAGVGVTAIYAVAVLGITRVLDMTRDGRSLEAGAYGLLAIVSFSVVIGACVFGIVVLTQ